MPLVDSLIESYFRRRMVWNIAKRRQVRLPDPIYQHMTREGCNWGAVLLWPITLVWKFLKKLSRKILYFLTVKEATDKLSYYWHRAYLLDYMIVQGHLEQEETAVLARTALEQVLDTITTSPLTKVAQQVANNARHVWRTLRRVRLRNQEDETIAASKAMMDEQWEESATYLATIAQQYELLYEQQVAMSKEERTSDEVRSTNGEGQMTNDTDQ
ncbi:MAG: hypothetical protein IPL28_02100 [Chloroflexi bacterium]|nr:hypothetical protein [Chloroflexota bacterium]